MLSAERPPCGTFCLRSVRPAAHSVCGAPNPAVRPICGSRSLRCAHPAVRTVSAVRAVCGAHCLCGAHALRCALSAARTSCGARYLRCARPAVRTVCGALASSRSVQTAERLNCGRPSEPAEQSQKFPRCNHLSHELRQPAALEQNLPKVLALIPPAFQAVVKSKHCHKSALIPPVTAPLRTSALDSLRGCAAPSSNLSRAWPT